MSFFCDSLLFIVVGFPNAFPNVSMVSIFSLGLFEALGVSSWQRCVWKSVPWYQAWSQTRPRSKLAPSPSLPFVSGCLKDMPLACLRVGFPPVNFIVCAFCFFSDSVSLRVCFFFRCCLLGSPSPVFSSSVSSAGWGAFCCLISKKRKHGVSKICLQHSQLIVRVYMIRIFFDLGQKPIYVS